MSDPQDRLCKVLDGVPRAWKNILYSAQPHQMGHAIRTSAQLLDQVLAALGDVDVSNLCPEPNKWFEFARLTPLEDVRVVIMGQDPYHTKVNDSCVAHGLAFSCLGSVPPSLRNIYKCLEASALIASHKAVTSGDLTPWAKQGVLLLNAALSTEAGHPNQHQGIWIAYVEFVLQRICEYAMDQADQLIIFLWGKNSHSFATLIDQDFHIVKKWAHPSPLAPGALAAPDKFINCDHFAVANEFLESWGSNPIDWNIGGEAATIGPTPDQVDTSWFNGHGRKIVAFTDGSCDPNNKSAASRGGYASVFAQGPFRDKIIYGNLNIGKHFATNNRAEGQAIISTLEFIGSKENLDSWSECVIVTDSEFWINMINKYMPSWSEAKFKQKENYDMTTKLWRLWTALMANRELSLYHVRSHNKSGWKSSKSGTFEKYCYDQNDYADKMCGFARTSMEPGETVIADAEYE